MKVWQMDGGSKFVKKKRCFGFYDCLWRKMEYHGRENGLKSF